MIISEDIWKLVHIPGQTSAHSTFFFFFFFFVQHPAHNTSLKSLCCNRAMPTQFSKQKFTRNTHQTHVDFQVCPRSVCLFHLFSCLLCQEKKQKRKRVREMDELLKKKKVYKKHLPAQVDSWVCQRIHAPSESSIFFYISFVRKRIAKKESDGWFTRKRKKSFQKHSPDTCWFSGLWKGPHFVSFFCCFQSSFSRKKK